MRFDLHVGKLFLSTLISNVSIGGVSSVKDFTTHTKETKGNNLNIVEEK